MTEQEGRHPHAQGRRGGAEPYVSIDNNDMEVGEKGSQLERGREGGSFIASSTRSSLARAHECECMSSIGPSRTMPWRFRSRSIKGRTQYSYAYVFAGKKSQQSTQIFVSKALRPNITRQKNCLLVPTSLVTSLPAFLHPLLSAEISLHFSISVVKSEGEE